MDGNTSVVANLRNRSTESSIPGASTPFRQELRDVHHLAAAYEANGNAGAARAAYAACAKQATGGRRAECAALLAQ
jgi:hypothetical protein